MKILVYSTPTCPFCKRAKAFLAEHNIAFTDIDVTSDQAKAQEMIKRSGQMGVPVIIVGEGDKEEMIVGFDQKALKKALGL